MKISLLNLASGTLPQFENPAAKYTTDKVDHGYLPFYERHLPETVEKFMEIGVWKGDSLRMFRDYYRRRGEFHALDVFGTMETGVTSEDQFRKEGFITHRGSQSDLEFLGSISDQFDVIVEDGSHHSDEQIISFKHLFVHNVKSGGWYILEDLCCCTDPFWWRCITSFKETMLGILPVVIDGGDFTSQLITDEESDQLKLLLAEIHLENRARSPIAFFKRR